MTSEFVPREPMQCSVVVTTWQRPIELRDTIQSLLQQTYTPLEIVVVCDGEDPAVRTLSTEFQAEQRIRFIFHAHNRGLPAARNTGAQAATGEIVLFLDDDVVADPRLVATHMAHHVSASPFRRIAVYAQAAEKRATPLSSYLDRRLNESWQQTLKTIQETLALEGPDSVAESVQECVCFGLNCSIARELFLQHGGFNERFRESDEEMEFGYRLHAAGVEFVCEKEMLLEHRNAKSLEPYFLKSWRASGPLDVHRVFDLNQKTPQTQKLASLAHGYLTDRLLARMAWDRADGLGKLTRRLSNRLKKSEMPSLYGIWNRAARASAYWSAVKETGCTPGQIAEAAGHTKTALMLHSICTPFTPEESSYYLSPQRFREYFRWFRNAGFKTVTTGQWLQDQVPAKHVLLTFDDGYDDLYTEMFPLFTECGFTALIFLVSDQIGTSNVWDQRRGLRARNLLTLDQIREMQRHGFEFGSHTVTHPFLPDVGDTNLVREVRDSKQRLEDLLGVEIASFAYPYGGVDRRVRSAVIDAGYKQAFTTLPGSNWWNDPFAQRRADINDYTSSRDFRWKVRTGLGFTESIGARLRSLESTLPTPILRKIAGRMGKMGHAAVHSAHRRS